MSEIIPASHVMCNVTFFPTSIGPLPVPDDEDDDEDSAEPCIIRQFTHGEALLDEEDVEPLLELDVEEEDDNMLDELEERPLELEDDVELLEGGGLPLLLLDELLEGGVLELDEEGPWEEEELLMRIFFLRKRIG